MFLFKPAIKNSAGLYELPRPVTSLRIQDSWDLEQFKVPLLDGDFSAGHSQSGVDILIEGQCGAQAGELILSEQQMFEELEHLRQALHVSSAEDRYDLFLYHDPATSTYRRFKNCSTLRFEYDLSRKQLFTYSIAIHANDPTIYTTAP